MAFYHITKAAKSANELKMKARLNLATEILHFSHTFQTKDEVLDNDWLFPKELTI